MQYDIEKLLTVITGGYAPKLTDDGYRSICCFHEDTSYDLLVNDDGRYYCFACGEQGSSLITLISKLYNLPDYDYDGAENALDFLYEFTEEGSGGSPFQVQQRARLQSERLKQHHEENLAAAQEYYKGEFFGDPLANKNYDCYTPGYVYLYSRGFLSTTLKHYHVFDWQRFREHPLFVPYAFNGHCFGYELRRISEYAWPKTLTVSGTQKSQHLHGFAPTKKSIGLVTEGPFDQMVAWQYGYRKHAQFTVMGSHISMQQAHIMATHCNILVSAFDNDDAGENAHESLCESIARLPVHIKILRLRVASYGLSCMTEQDFHEGLDRCLKQIGKDHTAVLEAI